MKNWKKAELTIIKGEMKMDSLKKYIEHNRAEFERDLLPEGSKERFMNKISRGNNKTLLRKMPYWTKLAVASSIIIMIALPAVISERSSKLDSGEYYIEILAKQTMEIEKLSSNLGDYEKLNIESTLRQLNEESVPLADQLPNSISKRERREILKEYYTEKIDGAERLEKYVLGLVGK
ncbi:hypothetical protein U5907_01815 [Bacteroidales bacterium MB20-C3-3]|nr:hypothetical protein U5907_01815 [Bacteroidales bacterium MB20-C3-3]